MAKEFPMPSWDNLNDVEWLQETINMADEEIKAFEVEIDKLKTRVNNAKQLKTDCINRIRHIKTYTDAHPDSIVQFRMSNDG